MGSEGERKEEREMRREGYLEKDALSYNFPFLKIATYTPEVGVTFDNRCSHKNDLKSHILESHVIYNFSIYKLHKLI